VTQHDWHPTTEQLSAFLDGQLSSDEQGEWDAHIKTCEQCQQELAALRLTVNLLRALPQPDLPRSFALPVNTAVTPIADYSTQRVSRSPAQRRRTWPVVLRTTARSLCAIAAVLGLFLLSWGLLTGLLRPGSGTATSMSAPAASSAQSTGGSASGGGGSATSRNVPPTATHPQASSAPEITPTAPPTMGPYAVKPGSPQKSDHTAAAQAANPLRPVLAFFDISTTGGSIALGLLLLLLGATGYILLLGRRPKARAP